MISIAWPRSTLWSSLSRTSVFSFFFFFLCWVLIATTEQLILHFPQLVYIRGPCRLAPTGCGHVTSRCPSHLWADRPPAPPLHAHCVPTDCAAVYEMGLMADTSASGLVWEMGEIMLWELLETEALCRHTLLSWGYLEYMPTQVQTRVLAEETQRFNSLTRKNTDWNAIGVS